MKLVDIETIKLPKGFFEEVNNVPKFYEWLDGLPTTDAESIKHGRWIYIRDEENNGLYECSECHKGDIHAKECEVSYCWNCGAKMDGGENER